MLRKLAGTALLILSSLLFGLIIYLIIIYAGQYVIDEEKLVMNATTTLVDTKGSVVSRLFIEDREPVSILDVPDHVKHAFIAIEDARFHDHQGIDFRAIGRALYRDMLAGEKLEGGSTITQQLVKNAFLDHEKTWLRKTKEVLIAMNLERRYSKSAILEFYLNQIYFGHGAYGIQSAANLYFDKDVSDLTVEEGAVLAGLAKAPTIYSPIIDLERSKQRRDLVLTVMQRQGFITAEEAVRAKGRLIQLDVNEPAEEEAYLTYIDMVIDEAESQYHLSHQEFMTGGYTVVVPIDQAVQEVAFTLIHEKKYYPKGNEDAQSAFVLLDARTGGVLAVQGGKDYVRRGLNRVNVPRQPGSTFKPLAVFAPALEEGRAEPYSLLRDELRTYDGYEPHNFGDEYEEEVTLYDAITQSKNAPAVWLLNELGIPTAKQYLQRQGFQLDDEGLAIALGGLQDGVTPLELASAYQVFANGGKKREPYFIEAIYNREGEKMAEVDRTETQVYSPQTAWSMTRMLESVVREGTGTSAQGIGALAGKTGTTSFPEVEGATMDAWFAGYTPEAVGTVWMGYDITSTESYLKGGSRYSAKLFRDILSEATPQLRATNFSKPDDVEELNPPVRLVDIDDLKATFAMGGTGLMSIKLEWSGSEDERLHYYIYERRGAERTYVGRTEGTDQYYIPAINAFSMNDYQVVPYDPTTKRKGEPSNIAEVEFRFGFHESVGD
ncbi:penicillin-binding protein 1A [Halalkalibacterium halodurans]|uniref:penicillin-binding protein 1A n=1 Tax=Halalkalibacterium halodurans TaxID=86665 RepID=UPI0010674917|nr:penicillin-binding protein 1A [Halalkalibacterium halodurans]TES55546.1 penicillin-binding protein 1A [Halalkalibacterium halodurans]